MKIIYKKTIIEMIQEAHKEARKQNREIEKLILDDKEWSELLEVMGVITCTSPFSFFDLMCEKEVEL